MLSCWSAVQLFIARERDPKAKGADRGVLGIRLLVALERPLVTYDNT